MVPSPADSGVSTSSRQATARSIGILRAAYNRTADALAARWRLGSSQETAAFGSIGSQDNVSIAVFWTQTDVGGPLGGVLPFAVQ
jgi:hypothetical protein